MEQAIPSNQRLDLSGFNIKVSVPSCYRKVCCILACGVFHTIIMMMIFSKKEFINPSL